jgi:hypothetical protein
MSAQVVNELLDEMEEYFGAFGYFPLYLLGWHLNDGVRTVPEKHDLARQAFDIFTRRHPTKVVLDTWPLKLKQTTALMPGTPLDFELDPDGPLGDPMQVLVPATP